MRFFASIFFVFIFSLSNAQYARKVNPFIGTGGHGHTYPGAVFPFGMVQPSPDTRTEGWDACSGYHYSDSTILGFSQTHLSGTGIADYCDILIMPTIKEPDLHKGYQDFQSSFSHKSEKAYAGYYEVFLSTPKIKAEITASARVAHYRFTPTQKSEYIYCVIDLAHRDQVLDHDINVIDEQNINGKRISKSWAQQQHIYFHLSSDQSMSYVKQDENGQKMVLRMKYAPEIQIKIALSPVSEHNAKLNMEKEVPHFNWSQTLAENQKAWEKELQRIEFHGTPEQDTIFYTALYHNFIVPNLFQDVNGDYRGTDLKVHHDTSFNYYTVFSLWDTYRTTHALYDLIMPDRALDFIKTLLQQYKDGGQLPMWELAGNYTGCMIGYHAASVISEAYLKGITAFDTRLALKAMISETQALELGKPAFRQKQVIEINDEHESVSKTLEYSYDDYAIGTYANAIGDKNTAEKFLESSKNYLNLINAETKFVQPRMEGSFVPFDPTAVNYHYTEANGWQYNFGMPHDIIEYLKVLGGPDSLERKLDEMFSTTSLSGRNQVDITGLIGQYAHGNEPSHHVSHVYNFTNSPSKTQFYTQKIINNFYNNSPDGLIGNEDCGQMSAWYIFNAMGFYPFVPASNYYTLTSPVARYVKINLENGNIFEIVNNPKEDTLTYISEMTLNGSSHEKRFITHDEIVNSGVLRFTSSTQPQDEKWADYLFPLQKVKSTIPLPFFKYENYVFRDSVKVEINHLYDYVDLFYEIGENGTYQEYTHPLTIKQNTKIYTYASFKMRKSNEATATFHQLQHNLTIQSLSPYDTSYDGGNKDALIDGIISPDHYHSGFWQGFYDTSLHVVLKMEERKTIESVKVGFLNDPRSWIWVPKNMKVYGSKKGKKYKLLGTTPAPYDRTNTTEERIEYKVQLEKAKPFKYIKIVAEYPGDIPEWHPGRGKPCYIFADEIIIR